MTPSGTDPSPAPPGEKPEAARRGGVGINSTGVFVISVIIQLLGFIPTHIFAAHVGAFQVTEMVQGQWVTIHPGLGILGTFQFFLLLASSINMIGDLRIGTAYTFFVARGEPSEISTGTYLVLRFVMVGFAGAALLVVALTGPWNLTEGQSLELFGLWMLLPVIWSVPTVYGQLLAAQGRSTIGQVPLLVESGVRTAALTVVAVASLNLGWEAFPDILFPITFCYLLGASASALISVPEVWRRTRAARADVTRRLFRFAWPLMGSLLLLYLSTTIIQFIVVAVYSTTTYTEFLAANGFRILALSIPAAVAVPLFPHLSGLHKAQDYDLLRNRTWAALRYTAMVVLPTAMVMVIYRVPLLNTFYVSTYAVAATSLALLGIASVPASLSQIIGTALNSVGRQRLELYLTTVQFVVLLAACAVLMGPWHVGGFDGLAAAGIAVLASGVAALAVNTYFMERLLGVRIQVRSVVTLTVAAAVSFGAVAIFNDFIIENGVEILVAGIVLGFTAYAFLLAGLGELSKKDVMLIVGALGLPRSLGRTLSKLCWRVDAWPVNPLPPGTGLALRPLEGAMAPLEPALPEVVPDEEPPTSGR